MAYPSRNTAYGYARDPMGHGRSPYPSGGLSTNDRLHPSHTRGYGRQAPNYMQDGEDYEDGFMNGRGHGFEEDGYSDEGQDEEDRFAEQQFREPGGLGRGRRDSQDSRGRGRRDSWESRDGGGRGRRDSRDSRGRGRRDSRESRNGDLSTGQRMNPHQGPQAGLYADPRTGTPLQDFQRGRMMGQGRDPRGIYGESRSGRGGYGPQDAESVYLDPHTAEFMYMDPYTASAGRTMPGGGRGRDRMGDPYAEMEAGYRDMYGLMEAPAGRRGGGRRSDLNGQPGVDFRTGRAHGAMGGGDPRRGEMGGFARGCYEGGRGGDDLPYDFEYEAGY